MLHRSEARIRSCAVFSFLMLFIHVAPSSADQAPKERSIAPEFMAQAGAIIGLEMPLRGGKAVAGFGLAGVPFCPSIRLGLIGDAELSAWIMEPCLAIGLGRDCALILGFVLPLSEAYLVTGSNQGAGDGHLRLVAAGMPSLFGVEARVAKCRLTNSMALSAIAELAWRTWAIAAEQADVPESDHLLPYASDDALRAFAAGFMASVTLRFEFRPWRVGWGP